MFNRVIVWVRAHPVVFSCLVVTLLLGAGLRFTHVGSTMQFSGDEARDAFLVRSIARDGQVQLLGAPTSIGNGEFKLGPAFLYMLVPGYLLAGERPVGGAWTVAILSFISIFLVYLLGKRLVNIRVGVIAALLYGVSYVVVTHGRWQWNPNVAPFFILLVMLGIHALASPSRKHVTAWVVTLGVSTGILLQLHATALFVLPPLLILLFLLLKIRLRWWQYLLGLALVALIQFPMLLYDLQHNFANTRGLWQIVLGDGVAPYGFSWRVDHTLRGFYHFFNDILLAQRFRVLAVAVSALGISVLGWRVLRTWRQGWSSGAAIILTWLLVPFVIFHAFTGELFPHYFSIIFPVPFLIVGVAADWLWQQRGLRTLALPLVGAFFAIATFQTVSALHALRPGGPRTADVPITLQDLQDAAAYITADAQGKTFQVTADPVAYGRSLEYLVDQAGHPPDSKASLAFTVLLGQAANETSYRGSRTVVGAHVFPYYTIIEQELGAPR